MAAFMDLHAAPLSDNTLVSVLVFLESNNYSRRSVALASMKGMTYTIKEYRTPKIYYYISFVIA